MKVTQLVNGLNTADDFCNVELCHIFWKDVVVLAHQGKKVTTRVVVHHQVEVTFVLETAIQGGQPRMGTVLVGGSKEHDVPLLLELGDLMG